MIEASVGKEKRSDFHHLSFDRKICIDFKHKNAIRERDSSKQWFYKFLRLGNVSILIWTRQALKNILRENPISGWSGRVLGTCLSKLKALGSPWA